MCECVGGGGWVPVQVPGQCFQSHVHSGHTHRPGQALPDCPSVPFLNRVYAYMLPSLTMPLGRPLVGAGCQGAPSGVLGRAVLEVPLPGPPGCHWAVHREGHVRGGGGLQASAAPEPEQRAGHATLLSVPCRGTCAQLLPVLWGFTVAVEPAPHLNIATMIACCAAGSTRGLRVWHCVRA